MLGKEILWDYPKDFIRYGGTRNCVDGYIAAYPYSNDVSAISDLLREYIETPKEMLFEKHFENDKWGLINILKSADRRMGKRRLVKLKKKTRNIAAHKIISQRLPTHQ